MKVALLASASSIHTIRWANGLVRAGVKVNLLTQHAASAAIDERVKVTKIPNCGNVGYFLNAPVVRWHLGRFRPDVLNAQFASGYGTTARLTRFHPLVVSVWGSDVYDFPERSRMHRWLLRRNLEAADVVASTSRCMADQTRRIAPSLDEIAVTPFGIDCNVFSPSTDHKNGDQDGHTVVVGTVKSLGSKYGVDLLIRAFAHLREHLQSLGDADADRLRLRIVGEGPDRRALERLASLLGVAEITEFVGKVSHGAVPSELAKLDIYVALSRSESFGVAVLEAGAAGCPVVVADVGGLPEVVVHSKTGLVVPREDVAASAEAIGKLVKNGEMRRSFGEAGRTHVTENYSWSNCITTMLETLERACDKWSEGRCGAK